MEMSLLSTSMQATTLKARLFRGFADPSRLSLLEALREGPQTVGALVSITGLSQPNTSNHLNCLYDCGLVRRVPRGRFVLYELADPRVGELLHLAEELLLETARGVEHCLRYAAPEEGVTDEKQAARDESSLRRGRE